MFDTDLAKDYEAATAFGIAPRTFYEAGVKGAACDEETRARLAAIGAAYPWPS
jgi:aminodeoxyfutalosine deaminase